MKKFAVLVAVLALTACGPREEEAGGEVVDTLNTPNLDVDLGLTRDTLDTAIVGDSDTVSLKKPFGRKPVDMKDSTRRP